MSIFLLKEILTFCQIFSESLISKHCSLLRNIPGKSVVLLKPLLLFGSQLN